MKLVNVLLIIVAAFSIIACSGFSNPTSSEIDEEQENNDEITIMFDTSGLNDNG